MRFISAHVEQQGFCPARRRQEAAVAAWAELRARGAPVLRAWRALQLGHETTTAGRVLFFFFFLWFLPVSFFGGLEGVVVWDTPLRGPPCGSLLRWFTLCVSVANIERENLIMPFLAEGKR